MNRRTFVVAALAAGALLVAACAGSTPEEGDGGELVWAVGGAPAKPGGPHHDTVAMWNELHPDGPKVRIETLPEAADEQRQQLSLELNAQGSNFDILGLDVIWTGEFAENGWLESLEDLRPQIEPVSVPGSFQSATWTGTLWAAPYSTNAGFLYYRTDLVDRPPTRWDELTRIGTQAAQKAGIAPFVGQGAQYEGMVVNFLEYLWGAGGDLFNKTGTRVLFDDQPALEAVTFMRTSLQNGFYAPGFNTMKEEEARNTFQSGKAVFMRNWPYAYSLMSGEKGESAVAGKFAIAPLPTFTGEGTISALGGLNLAVSRFSDNVRAAKEFVLFASTNPDVQRTLGGNSLGPTRSAVYDDLSDDPVMAQLARILPDARPRPPAPEWNEISEEIQKQIFAAYNGQRDPQQAVEHIRTFLETTVKG